MTIDVSPFSKWGLSLPPDTAIPNPLLESFCRVTVYCSHISSSMPGAWSSRLSTNTSLCFVEYLCREGQLGCQSHSQGDDNNVAPRPLEAGGGVRAALGRASARRLRLRWRPLRSSRSPLMAPRRSRRAAGCPGSGRVRVASAAAPLYYCDSGYFLFGGISNVEAGGVGRRRARKRRQEG